MSGHAQSFTRNGLLSRMTATDYALLQPDLERVALTQRQVLDEPDQPVNHVYFIERGIGSLIAVQEDGSEIEVGLFGYEGLYGVSAILRADRSPLRSVIQLGDGSALRISSAALAAACDRSVALRTLLLRYVQSTIVQTAQTAASNAQYALPERLARWLLMCHDRSEGDEMTLTHEFLSVMLAVRRSGVTVTLHLLEGTGAVRGTRGLITVRDRARLEEIAGDSYGRAEAEYRRLVGPFGRGAAAAGSA
ncbi:Crp/Fnr family transcriptional regulator [Sphingomonas abaci]|uniref:CRP-like cAMP-binding protein n=1 Tax=Sphingomonas abaci TaxID=237611 RepID=A0A7W7F019_9SPHN|nr:Crp/Fnr family transcriptional regulator [Sphingomonas abaci]MBB4619699.1 CRP-like cAMP-binding protein [Sphingomonas abaci]